MHRRLREAGLVILLVALAGGLSLPLQGQSISGTIAGTVRDQKGGATTATVTAYNRASGREYSSPAGEDGNYSIPEVDVGVYDVRAESQGFQTVVVQHVRVDVSRTSHQDFVLPIPPQKEALTVESTAPITEPSAPTLRSDFDDTDVRQLPILTRDVNNLALLVAGVVDARTYSFGSTLVPFAANGSRGRDNNFIIDSVSNNEPLLGGAATQFTNTDIFAEYTVLTDQVKAEFGRTSGATINAITKGGSNTKHGSLFWFGQDQNFNALTQVEQQALLNSPPTSYENQAGFTLGGPLSKNNPDKLQYFISYQWDGALNNLSSVFPVVNTLPTPAGYNTLKGLPSTPALQVLLNTPTVSQVPATLAPCFGSIPSASATGSSTNPCFPPTPVMLTSGQQVQYGTYLVPNGNLFNQHDNQASGRLDYRINDANDVYGRYLFDDLRTPRAPLDPAGESAFSDLGLLSYWRDSLRQRTQSALLNWRHEWVSALNEFRFSAARIAQNSGPFNVPEGAREGQAAATVADQFGGFGQTQTSPGFSGNFPSAGSQFTLGSDTRPAKTTSNIFEVQENFSYLWRGKHSFKFGTDLIRTQTNIRSVPEDLGHYFFGIAKLSGGLSDFVSDTNEQAVFQRLPNLISDNAGNVVRQGSEELPLREFDQFFFIQDDYRASPHWTFNLGLRYENFGQPINGMAQFNPAAPHVANDNNNLAPRIGFAWSPGSKRTLVVRGGYGLMYDQMVLNIPLLIWQSGPISPLVQSIVTVPSDRANQAAQPSGLFPNLPFSISDVSKPVAGCDPSHTNKDAQGNPILVPLIGCSSQVTVDPHLVNPYVQTWTMGLQQSISSNLLFEVDYVGNKGTKNYQLVDTNPFQGWDRQGTGLIANCPLGLLGSGFSYNCLQDRRTPGRGDIQAITNSGFSTYNALQVSLTQRTTHRAFGDLAFTTAYTWSHTIDNASEIFGPGVRFIAGDFAGTLQNPETEQLVQAVTPLPQDSSNLQVEKGNSSYDRRHRLAISYIWELPSNFSGAAASWFNHWQINGVAELQSGQPFTPLNGAPLGACADAYGEGILTNARPAIGSRFAPSNSVALLADLNCIDLTQGYVGLDGKPIDPGTAHFVQVPLGEKPGAAFSIPGTGESFVAGSAGRNILVGPGIANLDFALYKSFSLGEHKRLQFRWEIYDVLNHPNPGFPIGNVFATQAQQTFGYAFSPRTTPAGVTGVIPESTIDSVNGAGVKNFLSKQYMNTSNRRMQFGIHFTF